MTTNIEYALMAGASYISNHPKINRFPVPQGWTEIEDKRQALPSGFEATYFVKGSNIVISFAGTGLGWGDWIHGNTPLALGVLATQLKQATDYYLQIKAANSGASITLTGHSLGGGLAALIAVMFDETAVTFDQAPFNQSALFFTQTNPITHEVTTTSVAQALRNYLADHASTTELAKLDAYITANNNPSPNAADTVAGRASKVTDINTQGEILSGLPLLNRIGSQANLLNSHTDVSATDLHSQALLSALLQSGDTANTTASDHTLGQVSFKLKDLLKMIFDKNLYYNDPNNTNNPQENFLERLVIHQATVIDPAIGATDVMVTRFTHDLWKLAQDGGLTMADGNLTDATKNKVSQALTAFAMQFYYEDTTNAKDAIKELFTNLSKVGSSNGVQFYIGDVSTKIQAAIDAGQQIRLNEAKGFEQYFLKYINDIANFSIEEQKLIQSILPSLRDWYVQAGVNGMNVTDDKNRGAFMLGGSDTMTGAANDSRYENFLERNVA